MVVHIDQSLMERLAVESERKAQSFAAGSQERTRYEDMARGYRDAADREEIARQADQETGAAIEQEYNRAQESPVDATAKMLLALAILCAAVIVYLNLPTVHSIPQGVLIGLEVLALIIIGMGARYWWERVK
jgi:hypothetical protein